MYDLIVIGGGPAGLAAATYARAKGLHTLLVCPRLGGRAGDQLRPPGALAEAEGGPDAPVAELVGRLARSSQAQPGLVFNDLVTSVSQGAAGLEVVTERGGAILATAAILATGAQPRLLGVPHEWELVGHGLGYSITSHAQAVAGQVVAVVGATERALRGVAELAQAARRVVLVSPERGALEGRLSPGLWAHPAVEVLEGYRVQRVEAEGRQVRALWLARGDELREVAVAAVFVDLGLVPSSQMVRHLAQLDAAGRVLVDDQLRTSAPGLFAAGDVTSAPCEQVLVALGAGARAAVSAYTYILERRVGRPASDLAERIVGDA